MNLMYPWKINSRKILALLLLSSVISSAFIQPANAKTKIFGVMGRNASNGRSGRNGLPGKDISIKASEQFKSFDISGSKGRNGKLGYPGENASNCQQPEKVRYNLQGSKGGNGGNGGNGGSGGNGGNAVIYFQNTAQLKNIVLNNSGGRGGMGGKGGRGGKGCQATNKNWYTYSCIWALKQKQKQVPDARWTEVTRKHFPCSGDSLFDEQNHRPKPRRENSQYRYGWKYIGVGRKFQYIAKSGKNGHDGSNGKKGASGNYGQVLLVKGETIPQEKINYSNRLSSINGKTIQLLKNNWLKKNSLRQFLGENSDIPSTYKLLQTVRNSFSVDWKTEKSFTELGNPSINVSINSDGNLDFNIPDTLEYQKMIQPDKTTINIVGGIDPNRLKKFKFRGFDRFRDTRNFAVLDEGDLLKEIKGLIINIKLSNGNRSKDISYTITSSNPETKGLKVWGNLYKFQLGEEFESLLQPGQEITYNIKMTQITKSGGYYTSGMQVKQVVNRVIPQPYIKYY